MFYACIELSIGHFFVAFSEEFSTEMFSLAQQIKKGFLLKTKEKKSLVDDDEGL